jgi:acylphosphatase
MRKSFSIRVSGKVQGVFFRASTKEKADELNIQGVVKNESDGSVSIEAEGEENNLQVFIAWCKQGPQRAQVNRCESTEREFRNYKSFNIIR